MLRSTLVIGLLPVWTPTVAALEERFAPACVHGIAGMRGRRPSNCRSSATLLVRLRASAVQAELIDPAVQRGARQIEELRRLRDVASRAGERALQHGPFGGVDVVAFGMSAPMTSAAGRGRAKVCASMPSASRAARVAPTTRSSRSTASNAGPARSAAGASRIRARGKARRKFSASIARAASDTAAAISFTKPSVRSARHDETSSAAASSPRSS